MSGEAFVLGLLALATIIICVVLWSIFATARTRIAADRKHDDEPAPRRDGP